MLGSGIPRGKSLQPQWVIGILLLALLPGPSVAQKSYGTRIASVKRVNSPASNASAFDLGWHYRIDVKHQGEPVLVALNARIGSLEGVDLNTLKLAYYDDKERRYQIVSNVLLDAEGRFEVPVERSGTYSLIALPSLPFPVQAVAKLCTAPDKPEIRLTKPQLDELCPRIYCPAFKESGLPKPFDGGSTCDRCYDLNGRAPREIAECGLLPFDTAKKIDPKLPAFSCAAFQNIAEIPDPSTTGRYATTSVNYRCGDLTGRSEGLAVFPAEVPSGVKLPLVLYLHGTDQSYRGYGYVQARLASHGFATISINRRGSDTSSYSGPASVYSRVLGIKHHLDCWRDGQAHILESGNINNLLSKRIDFNNIGLAGHSRGGEAIALAVQRNRDERWGYGIRAIHAIAPTDEYGNVTVDDIPYLVLLGAGDTDTRAEGLKAFDRAKENNPKIQAFLYGANHDWFNSESGADRGTPQFPNATRIPAHLQRQVERVLAVAFFRHFLQGFGPSRDLWTGKARTASLDTVRLFWSYQDPDSLLVDTFEPSGTLRNPFRNDLGGQNESIPGIGRIHPISGAPTPNRLAPLREVSLGNVPFQHETSGLQLGWNLPTFVQSYQVPTGRYEIHIPSKYRRTVALKPYLAFRVAQYFDPVANSSGQPQDFEVGLEDANGNQAYVKVSDFAEIPWPYERADGNTKSVLQTVRIPLCTFSNKKNGLNTESIAKILFRFNERATGLLAFDDVQFTK
jgi:dienelactone hydrolase